MKKKRWHRRRGGAVRAIQFHLSRKETTDASQRDGRRFERRGPGHHRWSLGRRRSARRVSRGPRRMRTRFPPVTAIEISLTPRAPCRCPPRSKHSARDGKRIPALMESEGGSRPPPRRCLPCAGGRPGTSLRDAPLEVRTSCPLWRSPGIRSWFMSSARVESRRVRGAALIGGGTFSSRLCNLKS